jgi:hypothetical protein
MQRYNLDSSICKVSRSRFLLIATVMMLFSSCFTSIAQSPNRLSADDIIGMLKHHVPSSLVSRKIKRDGIDFRSTPVLEDQFRRMGASDELIQTIATYQPVVPRTNPSSQTDSPPKTTNETLQVPTIGTDNPPKHDVLTDVKKPRDRPVMSTSDLNATHQQVRSSVDETTPEVPEPFFMHRKVSEADLIGKSKEDLRLMRNEIYARKGRRFKDQALQQHFDAQDWYRPQYAPEEFPIGILNSIQIRNLDFLTKYEHFTR